MAEGLVGGSRRKPELEQIAALVDGAALERLSGDLDATPARRRSLA